MTRDETNRGATPVTPEAQEQARVEALLLGMKTGGVTPRRRRGCLFWVVMLGLLLWGGIVALTYLVEPERSIYTPEPSGEATAIGYGQALLLPAGWTVLNGGQAGDESGSRLALVTSDVLRLGIAPCDLKGKPVRGVYTAAAYGLELQKVAPEGAKLLYARYLDLGERSGVEAAVEVKEKGEHLRGFVLVDRQMNCIEIRFRLPSGPETPAWQTAAQIFRSLRPAPRTPGRKPAQRSRPAKPMEPH